MLLADYLWLIWQEYSQIVDYIIQLILNITSEYIVDEKKVEFLRN